MPRKKGGKAKGGPLKPRKPSKSDASIKKWKTAADVPLDEVDEFHDSRDKILLEGHEDAYRDEDEDEEVFALKGMPAEEDSDDDEGGVMDYDEEVEEEEGAPAPKSKTKKAKKKKGKADESSDEDKEEDEEEETWGRGKAVYYNGNADQLESDDEEGHELEEQEATRLQSKAREHMTDEDFGLQDVVDVQRDDMDVLLEEPTPVVAPMPTEPQEIIRHLQKTNPEALALARDWEDTAEDLAHAGNKIKQVEAETPNAPKLGLLHFHYQTLLSYASVLAFYIHLRAMPKYAQKPALLQSHPVMTQLLKLKRALITMEDLGLGVTDDEDEDDDEAFDEDNSVLGGAEFLDWLTTGQLSGALNDSDEESEDVASSELPVKKKSKKTKEPPKKKRKVQKDSDHAKPIFDLEEPEFVSTKKKTSTQPSADDDVYGEAEFLQTADAADKSARKKTLQFHTSRIESASARRQSARNHAMGGDDDIPYRERQKQIALRAEQEAKKRLAQQGGEDLDDVEPELPSRKRSRDGDSDDESASGGEGSADEYYELVRKKSKEKKQKKKEEHEAARAEERIIEEDDPSGPRSLTRAILKNRGLTPHRSKAVRNPRVKKRQRYDQAKKKLSSQKAIYKGGVSETKGTYGGEKSGISKVIKSVRLG